MNFRPATSSPRASRLWPPTSPRFTRRWAAVGAMTTMILAPLRPARTQARAGIGFKKNSWILPNGLSNSAALTKPCLAMDDLCSLADHGPQVTVVGCLLRVSSLERVKAALGKVFANGFAYEKLILDDQYGMLVKAT